NSGVGGSAVDEDAVAQVAQARRPGGVGADEVAGDDVVRRHQGAIESAAADADAVAGVAADDVARAGRRAADGVVLHVQIQSYSVAAVPQAGGPRCVGADKVAFDDTTGRSLNDIHAVAAVAGDDVAGRGRSPAHRIAGSGGEKVDTHAKIGQRRCAAGVSANEIALDQVAGHVAVDDEDTGEIAGDNVPGPRGGAPD